MRAGAGLGVILHGERFLSFDRDGLYDIVIDKIFYLAKK
jgi:hypothetical protein